MSRLLVFWGCEPGAGRRTLARELARHWAERGQAALLLSVGSGASPSEPVAADPAAWVPQFQSLSPLMLRNYLATGAGPCAALRLDRWPAAGVCRPLIELLQRSFDWVAACLPQQWSAEEIAFLEASDLLVAVARPAPASAAGWRKLLEQLSRSHFPQ